MQGSARTFGVRMLITPGDFRLPHPASQLYIYTWLFQIMEILTQNRETIEEQSDFNLLVFEVKLLQIDCQKPQHAELDGRNPAIQK